MNKNLLCRIGIHDYEPYDCMVKRDIYQSVFREIGKEAASIYPEFDETIQFSVRGANWGEDVGAWVCLRCGKRDDGIARTREIAKARGWKEVHRRVEVVLRRRKARKLTGKE